MWILRLSLCQRAFPDFLPATINMQIRLHHDSEISVGVDVNISRTKVVYVSTWDGNNKQTFI